MNSSSETDDEVIWKKPPPPSTQEEEDVEVSLEEFRARFNMGSSSVVQKSMSTGTSSKSSSFQTAQSSSSGIKTQNQKLEKIMDQSRVKKPKVKQRNGKATQKTRTEGKSRECKIPCGFEGCPWFYRQKSHRDAHYATHFKEKNVHCDECESKFKNAVSLKQHKEIVHLKPEDAVFKCPSSGCGRLFKRRQVFRRHLASHDDARHCVCRVCQKAFTNDDRLLNHVWRVHQDPVPCKYCERLYNHVAIIAHKARHERKHNFFCELCQQDFFTLEERFSHIQSQSIGSTQISSWFS